MSKKDNYYVILPVAMNVFVKPFVLALAQALGAGANMRATVGTLLSVGWLPHVMPSSRRAGAS
jgi:hypothetical protein